jgi:phosphoribosylcarboxyaminoimidazole (NCAIR) mutase
MLVVTIELWPGGSSRHRRPIGTMHIGNESDLADVSDYWIIAMATANHLTGESACIAQFPVLAHPRRQRVWALIQRACEEAMMTDWTDL